MLVLTLLLPSVLAQKDPALFGRFPRVTRGPYLQLGTSDGVMIRWETLPASSTLVRYGLAPTDLRYSAGSPGRVREHAVALSRLAPNTRYYYSIGTRERVLHRGPDYYFVTAPVIGESRPIRVWVVGDPGTGYPVQRAVRDAYDRVSGPRRTDFVLALGDNAYKRGTAAQYTKFFFDVYRDRFRQAVVWPTLGNHDARNAWSPIESGVYYDVFTLPRRGEAGGTPSGTEAYYSFDYGNTHWICLNSEDVDLSRQGEMLAWLRRDLEANRATWTVAFWHQCPYSKGSHDSDSDKAEDLHMTLMRENVLPLLEAGGLDLALCGHSHLYERSFLISGHYGKSDSLRPDMILDRGDGRENGSGPYRKPLRGRGTVYVNAGSAGHATKWKDLHGLNHPVMCRSINVAGSLVLDIAAGWLRASFIDSSGQQLDQFTIKRAE